MVRFVAGLLLVAGLALPLQAGEFNKKLNIGDKAPVYTGLEGTDGKKHSLSDLKDKDVVVLVVTCNHCPFAVAYEDRIIDLAKKYTSKPDSKVALIAMSVSNYDADKMPEMKERAKEKKFTFPYIHDPSQKIGRALGVVRTPEFFVLNKEGKVVYMGAMDDSSDKPTVNYVEEAVKATLKGEKPSKTETRATGCPIEYLSKE